MEMIVQIEQQNLAKRFKLESELQRLISGFERPVAALQALLDAPLTAQGVMEQASSTLELVQRHNVLTRGVFVSMIQTDPNSQVEVFQSLFSLHALYYPISIYFLCSCAGLFVFFFGFFFFFFFFLDILVT
jgi:hypothetical protein